jgi:ribosomal protein S3AE
VHRSLSWSGKTRQVRVVIARFIQKQSGGSDTGKQLIEEVIPELMNNLIENVCVPDIRCNRTFPGEVSGHTALEARA